jgi:hypothetical protein
MNLSARLGVATIAPGNVLLVQRLHSISMNLGGQALPCRGAVSLERQIPVAQSTGDAVAG